MSFAEVSRRAGVTRQLVHRWWATRPTLVAEALFTSPTSWPAAYAGPLAADVHRLVRALVDYACRPEVRAGIQGLMSQAGPDTHLPGLVPGLLGPLHSSFADLVAVGQERGEVRPEVDVPMTLDTLRGAVTMHLIADATPPEQIVAHLSQLLTWALAATPTGTASLATWR